MSKEGDSLKLLKTQACVMRVNICCEGCQRKLKKVLLKTDGVDAVSISVEERKVTVTGSVEPDVLVNKLNKARKHAELLSVKGGGGGGSGGGKGQSFTGLLQKLQLEGQMKENGKAQKEGGGGGKEKKGQPVALAETQQGVRGFKDFKFPSFKDLKIPFKKDNSKAAAKLDPSPKEELDDGSDFDDEFDDDFDDEDDDDEELSNLGEYSDDELMMKPKAKDKGGEKGINGGGKNGGGGNDNNNKNNNNNKGGNGDNSCKNNAGSHASNGRPSSNKGGGGNNSVGGGLPIGQPHMMGQFGNMHPPMGLMGSNNAQGLPAGAYLPPETMAGGANPYQQQYLQALMQQQQRMMMNGLDRPTFQPMGYGNGPQPMYAPQPHPYTMFSDENPNGCSIM